MMGNGFLLTTLIKANFRYLFITLVSINVLLLPTKKKKRERTSLFVINMLVAHAACQMHDWHVARDKAMTDMFFKNGLPWNIL